MAQQLVVVTLSCCLMTMPNLVTRLQLLPGLSAGIRNVSINSFVFLIQIRIKEFPNFLKIATVGQVYPIINLLLETIHREITYRNANGKYMTVWRPLECCDTYVENVRKYL